MSTYHPALWLPSYAQGFARSRVDAANPGLRNGLVGMQQMTLGPTGARALDVSGNSNHGTLQSMDPATDWVMTEKGYALDCIGGGQHIALDRIAPLTNRFSVNALVYFRSTPDGFAGIISQLNGKYGSNRILLTNSGTQVLVQVFTDVQTNHSVTGLSDFRNAWHLFSVVYDGTDVAIYIDAEEIHRSAKTGNLAGGTYATTIGRGAVTTYDLDGRIAFTAVHDRDLAPGEIQTLYQDLHAIVRPMQRTGLSTPRVAGPYRTLIAGTSHTGAAAGEPFTVAATAGESFHTGPTAGQIDGRCD